MMITIIIMIIITIMMIIMIMMIITNKIQFYPLRDHNQGTKRPRVRSTDDINIVVIDMVSVLWV